MNTWQKGASHNGVSYDTYYLNNRFCVRERKDIAEKKRNVKKKLDKEKEHEKEKKHKKEAAMQTRRQQQLMTYEKPESTTESTDFPFLHEQLYIVYSSRAI